MVEEMDGLITFYNSYHAIRAEKVLRSAGYRVALIPGPRELSPNCGVALRFLYAHSEEVLPLLSGNKVEIEAMHEYRPRTANWPEIAASTEDPVRRLRFNRLGGKRFL